MLMSRHRLWSLINKRSQLQFLGKDFVWFRFRLRPPFCSSTLSLVTTLIFSVETPVPAFMSRPQRYVATLNGALHLKTSCNFVFFVETSFVALLTDPRRDIRLMSRHQSDVAIEDSTLNNSFSLYHTSFVATSFTCCLGHSGCKLNLKSRLQFSVVTSFLLVN